MSSPYLSQYEDPTEHAHISALIRRHSSNPQDVREAMLRSLDLREAEQVLDLGCGFGFWARELAGRVAPAACFTGIDACVRNEQSYVRSVEEAGRNARFIRAELTSELAFDDDRFDLVVAAYSLYFFVEIIPEVARVLRPGGRFLAVTHTEYSVAGLLKAMSMSGENSPLISLIREFSSENGATLLSRAFTRVERVDYVNVLTFGTEDQSDCLAYLRFKLPLLSGEAWHGECEPEEWIRRVSASLAQDREVVVQKNDTLFICGESDGG